MRFQHLIVALAALTFASAAQAQTTNAPNYLNSLGRLTAATGVTCINPTTKDPESCSGAGVGGSLSAKANAADQTSSEGATTDPISMDLNRYLRVISKQSGTWNINLPSGAATSALQGVQGTGSTYNPPTGGSGMIGFLSGIYAAAIDSTPATVNLTQLGGVTLPGGNGVVTSGAPRVAIASDNSPVAGLGVGATGSAVPANAVYSGTSQSGVTKGLISCDLHAFYDASDNGKKTIVAGVSAKKIYICGYMIATGGTATNVSLGSGTGTDCVTTYTAITPAFQLVANDRVGDHVAYWNGLITLANADNLCHDASAANLHQLEIWYTIQ